MGMTTKKPKPKRLVRGKDWHAWAWKSDTDGLYWWVNGYEGKDLLKEENPATWDKGKWVRVKFVEVES